MRSTLSSLAALGLITGTFALPACEEPGGNTGGTGATTTSTTTTGGGNTGGDTGGGDTGGESAGGATTGGGGTGGMPPVCPPAANGAPEVLSGDITGEKTLTADKVWKLEGIVYVTAGATLTIEPGTKIVGDKATLGTLVVQPGGKIMADGGANCPIVFTSAAPKGNRQPGDWGGVVLLGKAPVNLAGGVGNIEGIPVSPETTYGGNDPSDSSGVLRHVRIEFAGVQLSPNNEINSLTFGGVGDKTIVDHVEALNGFDDCFEFFGGTVNAKHLLCVYPEDDSFDWDNGYSGKLQFLASISKPESLEDSNGHEGDNDANGSTNTPISSPTIYNETACGMNLGAANAKQQYGWLVRRSSDMTIANAIVTGFQSCVDLRNDTAGIDITSSICFGNGYGQAENNIAFEEAEGGMGVLADDDGGLDERAWFLDPAKSNSEVDPKIDCFGATPNFVPDATIDGGAAAPPDDGFFDASAKYIGAFKAGDTWATGAWVSYDKN
jgi:hypothetical protein